MKARELDNKFDVAFNRLSVEFDKEVRTTSPLYFTWGRPHKK